MGVLLFVPGVRDPERQQLPLPGRPWRPAMTPIRPAAARRDLRRVVPAVPLRGDRLDRGAGARARARPATRCCSSRRGRPRAPSREAPERSGPEPRIGLAAVVPGRPVRHPPATGCRGRDALRGARAAAAFRAADRARPVAVHLGADGTTAGAPAGAPLVFTHHTRFGDYRHYLGPLAAPGVRAARRVPARYWRGCAAIVAPGSELATEISERLGRRRRPLVRTIPTGIEVAALAALPAVDPRPAAGWPADALVVATLGRLAPEKSVDLVLEAFADVAADEPGDPAADGGWRAIRGGASCAGRAAGPGRAGARDRLAAAARGARAGQGRGPPSGGIAHRDAGAGAGRGARLSGCRWWRSTDRASPIRCGTASTGWSSRSIRRRAERTRLAAALRDAGSRPGSPGRTGAGGGRRVRSLRRGQSASRSMVALYRELLARAGLTSSAIACTGCRGRVQCQPCA